MTKYEEDSHKLALQQEATRLSKLALEADINYIAGQISLHENEKINTVFEKKCLEAVNAGVSIKDLPMF